MSDLPARIARFRDQVRNAADLEAASRVFHDTLAMDPAFMALGRRHVDARLEEILAASLSPALAGEVTVLDMPLTRLDDVRLVHGAGIALVGRGPTQETVLLVIAYFEEDDIGLCVVLYEDDARATFMRFAVQPLAGHGLLCAGGSA